MKDYELTLKVRNAPLLNAMRAKGIETAAELSRLSGVTQGCIGDLLALKTTIYSGRGSVRSWVERIADALGALPEELAPPQHHNDPLKQNEFVAQVSADQLCQLSRRSEGDPAAYLEFLEAEESNPFEKMIGKLNDQQQKVLRMRFAEEKTLEECGEAIGVTKERVRQIEAMALRILRCKPGDALEAAGPYGENLISSYRRSLTAYIPPYAGHST